MSYNNSSGGSFAGNAGSAFAGAAGLMNNPWDDYRSDLQNIPGMANSLFSPFVQNGMNQQGVYTNALRSLLNPTALEDHVMGQYSTSPFAQYQMQQAQQANQRAAQAGGIAGTPQEMEALDKNIQGIASGSMQQYYNNAMQPYEYGLSGLSHTIDLGANMAGDQAGMMNNYYHDLGAADYGRDSENDQSIGLLGGGLAGLASMF